MGVVGCLAPPKNLGLDSDTEGADGSGDASGETSGGETDDSASSTGVPSGCAAIGDAATCDGTTDCAWVEITTIEGSGDFCGFEEPHGECIPTFYQGEGCGVFPACGVEGAETLFWASAPELGPDVFRMITSHSLCENQPTGFAMCEWDGDVQVAGPEACRCVCSGGSQALPPGVENELSDQSGCSDLFVYAVNEASTIALTVRVDGGYAMQANDTDTPVDAVFDASQEEVKFHVGTDLVSMFCTDVGGLGDIDASWTATSGMVTLHVEPGEAPLATATVTLENVDFVADVVGYDPYTLDDFYFEDIQVGWLPG